MSGFLSSLFGSSENHDSKKLVRSKRLRGRSLRMEVLEERALLSVTPADLAAIQDLFPDYEIADNTNYIEVTSTVDSGAGSLREAITQAGRTVEDDIIVVRQTSIDLLQTLQINIDADQFGSITIVGLTDSVAGLTNLSGDMSSDNLFQVLSVGAGTELNLGHLNISGGKATAGQNGGGISAIDATLNISDVRFRSNATAGVAYYEYGGAIYQQGGHSTLDNVTFISNSSVHGAALAVIGGTTDQTNVSYRDNKAFNASVECYGGGLYAEGSNVTLENAVFNRNEALLGSAVMLHSSVSTITGATITQNAGYEAVYVTNAYQPWDQPPQELPESTLNLRNSIVLGNAGSNDHRPGYFRADVFVNMGTPNFENNIIGTYYSNYGIDAESNQLGRYAAADVFNILENSYITLRDGSPAVNAGINDYVTTTRDAQGNNRIQQGTVDLGAVESKFSGEPVLDLPDLVPFAPDGWESPLIVAADPSSLQDVDLFEPGQNLFVSWALKNAGTLLAANNFKVELLLDGETIWENTFSPGLPVDYVLWQRGIMLYDLAVGEHTLQLRLDTLGAVTESDETNNVFTKTFLVEGPQADLTPFAPQGWSAPIVFADTPDGVVDADTIRPYETFFVSWGMTNIGDIPTQNGFQVALLIDGQEYWSNYYPPGLPVDYFLQYRGIQVYGLGIGEHEFELRIDSYNDVNESNETNNVFTRTLTIVEPLADFTVTTPDGWDSPIQLRQDFEDATPDRLLAEYPVILNAAVINQGTFYGETFVEVRVDGNFAGSFKIYGLEPGQTLVSPDIHLNLSPGEHRIELIIDPYNYVAELDETNNVYSETVFVDRIRPDFMFSHYYPDVPSVELWQHWQSSNGGNDFIADEPIDLRYTIANLAGYTQDSVSVGVYIDGQLYNTQQFGLYTPNSYYNSSSIFFEGLAVGEHTIEIRIDPDNLIVEENEENNIYRTTINVVAPDLVATELVLSSTPGAIEDDAQFVSDSPIFVHWSITNDGSAAPYRDYRVELFLNGSLLFQQNFYGDIPAGMELSRVFDNLYQGLPAGEYVFELRVNSDGRLTESDMSNNVLTKTITVVERIPQVNNLNGWLSSDTEIRLDWYAAEFDGLRFDVERSPAGSGQWEKVGVGEQNGPYWYFLDTNLQSGTAYEYRVVAYASDGQTSESNTIAMETPSMPVAPVPADLYAVELSAREVSLNWTATWEYGLYFVVQRAESGTDQWVDVGTTRSADGIGNFKWIDVRPDSSKVYDYRVVSYVYGGDSAISDVLTVSAWVPPYDLEFFTPADWALPVMVVDSEANYTVQGTFYMDRELYVGFGFRNTGNTYTGSVSATIYVDDVAIGQVNRNFSANSQQYVNYLTAIPSLVAGTHTVRVVLDEAGIVEENNEGNNIFSTTFTVIGVPETPQLDSVELADTAVSVSWTEIDGAAAYVVQRRVAGSGDSWTVVYQGTQTDFSDSVSGFSPGSVLEYRVLAYNRSGDSNWSGMASVTLPMPTVSAPDGLSASVRSSSLIDVSWNAVDGASSYRLERAVVGSSNWTTVYQGTATDFSNTGLAANTAYAYRVVAVDGNAVSEYSITITAQTQKSGTAAVPTGVQSTAVTKNSIAVSWSSDKNNVTGYTVQWSEDGTTWKSAAVKKNTTSYTITGLTAGTEYLVRVAAESKAGQSNWSDLLAVQTTAIPAKPAAPTALQLVSKTSSTATISWTPPASELTGYRIEYSFNGNSWSSITVGSNITEATITGLKSNKTYTIRIVALNGDVLSEYSSLLTV